MGAGGFIQMMVDSLKANNRPKKHIFNNGKKKIVTSEQLKKPLVKKTISEEDLLIIKKRIRFKAFLANRKRLIYRLSTLVLLLILFLVLSFRFYENNKNRQTEIANQTKHSTRKDFVKRQKLIIQGHQLINMGDYYAAKGKFYEAAAIDPNDYLLQLGIVTCDIRLCYSNNKYCTKAISGLRKLVEEYGDQPGIEQLIKEFNQLAALKKQGLKK